MALFQMKWLRRWVRRHTNPIPEDRARVWRGRLSIIYGLLAWNAFGVVCYMFYSGKGDWAKHYGYKSKEELTMTPAQEFSTRLNVDKGKIIRFKGLSYVGEEEFDNTKDKEEK